jgi:hypothetical protein
MSLNKRQKERLLTAPDEVLERIAAEQGDKQPTPEKPLAGRFSVQGVGMLSASDVKRELARRNEPA